MTSRINDEPDWELSPGEALGGSESGEWGVMEQGWATEGL